MSKTTSWFVICWFPGDTREASGVCALLVIQTSWYVCLVEKQDTILYSLGKLQFLVGGSGFSLLTLFQQEFTWQWLWKPSVWCLYIDRKCQIFLCTMDFFIAELPGFCVVCLFWTSWSFSLAQVSYFSLCSPAAVLPFIILCPLYVEQTPSSPPVSSHNVQDDWCNEE